MCRGKEGEETSAWMLKFIGNIFCLLVSMDVCDGAAELVSSCPIVSPLFISFPSSWWSQISQEF